MIRRWLPHPLLSALLALIWLVLNQSVSPGTVLLGVVFGVVLGRMLDLLDPPKARLRHYPLLLRLFVRVVLDIVRSNLAVARIVLFGKRPMHSGFVAIPLQLTDRYGLAVLSCIITSTPGTIWVSYDSSANILLIHVLDLVDEADWIDSIKQRYERPLLEIFP
ncbi:Na+/H+ antiporter subunit E [Rhodanobacter lindaniclasticus]|uniref:Na+/H+ antiporter subunit E n=1 Tax=Rhodanobacter lindaniclasticus TaxID=75310 RepID=A0A4S3KHH8_9GAMM|nr:Na+/H+ antiporter subunit E [Rhodanobacter lindaniclasticus]THD08155.1 Na+/H+ antiporter subunit E [Rhodanobacter lindaniclasticus]